MVYNFNINLSFGMCIIELDDTCDEHYKHIWCNSNYNNLYFVWILLFNWKSRFLNWVNSYPFWNFMEIPNLLNCFKKSKPNKFYWFKATFEVIDSEILKFHCVGELWWAHSSEKLCNEFLNGNFGWKLIANNKWYKIAIEFWLYLN